MGKPPWEQINQKDGAYTAMPAPAKPGYGNVLRSGTAAGHHALRDGEEHQSSGCEVMPLRMKLSAEHQNSARHYTESADQIDGALRPGREEATGDTESDAIARPIAPMRLLERSILEGIGL
ncbi:MAG: hypothetical protein IPO56_16945 [Flavobacteriales bacterium]|nr:hypothetical protein [Flavobacteriales bacterium]